MGKFGLREEKINFWGSNLLEREFAKGLQQIAALRHAVIM